MEFKVLHKDTECL